MRIFRGVYMRRFGLRARREKAFAALSKWDETIVPNWGDAANRLGLTTQNTAGSVYRTSGPDRLLYSGAHRVELRHAPSWQLAALNRNAGTVVSRSLGLVRTKLSRVWMLYFPRSRGRSERTSRRADGHAALDGGTTQRARGAWLRSSMVASPLPTSATRPRVSRSRASPDAGRSLGTGRVLEGAGRPRPTVIGGQSPPPRKPIQRTA